MTRKRKLIYSLLQQSQTPLNSIQIHHNLSGEMDLATVYRGLQYLEGEKLAASFVFECEERGMERYYVKRSSGHSHYMHCRSCHRFIPFPGCPLQLESTLPDALGGFIVEDHNITITGLCGDCHS